MNLKEAFRYQNFLDRTINTVSNFLAVKVNVMTVTQVHKKSAANAEAQDEIVIKEVEAFHGADPDKLARLLKILLNEKEFCADGVWTAKYEYLKKTGFNLDAQLAVNKHRQSAARLMSMLGSYKEAKNTAKGTGYKFNNDGVQTPYYYDVDETMAPAFDVQSMKACGKALARLADDVSVAADQCMIESVVDFVPMFNPTDSIEDIIETVDRELGWDDDEA